MLALIAAIGAGGQLGLHGRLPWPTLTGDRRWFRDLTLSADPLGLARAIVASGAPPDPALAEAHGYARDRSAGNACILGRHTYQSLPWTHGTVLPGRYAEVVSRQPHWDLPTTVRRLLDARRHPHLFVCGGAQVYAEALRHPALEALFVTEVAIDRDAPADTWWPGTFVPFNIVEGTTDDGRDWRRTACSPWLHEPDRPPYRFGVWEKRS